MLGELEYTMSDLFAQLGLACDDQAMEHFIAAHQLPESVCMRDAIFWDDKQRAFINEEYEKDAVWVLVMEELNVRLHESQTTATV